jgi:hypothetical protein
MLKTGYYCTSFHESEDASLKETARVLSNHGVTIETTSIQQLSSAEIPENTSVTPRSSHNTIHIEDKERSIHSVHIGKTGGSSLREATGIQCLNFKDPEACINRLFSSDQKLARQTRHVFHMWGHDEPLIRNATSFLMTLRNPVDRIISTYRFSHPENCQSHHQNQIHEPYGCNLLKTWAKSGKPKMTPHANKLYRVCFPSPAMEDFAQSVMSPWVPNESFGNLTTAQQQECRSMARSLVKGENNRGAAPHMEYNYEYYVSKTIQRFPQTEVFAVRTTHMWEDVVALDRLLGGSGKFVNHGRAISHGSEKFYSSPVSKEAYGKLCCVLEHEIYLYLDALKRSINLDALTKLESEEDLRQKCQVSTTWMNWRQMCRQRLEKDDGYLTA